MQTEPLEHSLALLLEALNNIAAELHGINKTLNLILDEKKGTDETWTPWSWIVKVDVGDITERMADEAYEDWDPDTLHGLKELEAALGKFEEANKDEVSWEPNYKKALILNQNKEKGE